MVEIVLPRLIRFFFKPQMFRDAKLGVQHSIPLSTNFKIVQIFCANFVKKEVWYAKQLKNYDNQSKVVDKMVSGFDAFRTYSFSSSLGTTIYGTLILVKTKK
jgi:hypothetical protein